MTKSMKRIHKVTIKIMADTDPDTSYLGEYSNTPTSEFSIDRKHSDECRAINRARDSYAYTHDYELRDNGEQECRNCEVALTDSKTQPCPAHDWSDDCDCSGALERGQYRYFNPSYNYCDRHGKALKDNTPEEIRKYVREDYARMEGYNNCQWSYIGIRAEAEIQLTKYGPLQEITSGGLWGTESDSGQEHIASIEQEELSDLSMQLHALGFSKRAIAAAFKNVIREEQ